MKNLIWRIKATYWYVYFLQTFNIKFCWNLAEASLENTGYDTTEDAKDWVEEELSYWGN